MLFSEPKIPQFYKCALSCELGRTFQCSSASRKFLNGERACARTVQHCASFSALQRAENSSIRLCSRRSTRVWKVSVLFSEPKIPQSELALPVLEQDQAFQCSSASRKFLNRHMLISTSFRRCFSALQRAENSSISWYVLVCTRAFTFQCSSASRKFLNCSCTPRAVAERRVSVLFSEPKIPQCTRS